MDNQFTCFICGGDHLPDAIDEGREGSWFWVTYRCPITGDGMLQWAGIYAINKDTPSWVKAEFGTTRSFEA